jgi:hypothetical protein
MSRMVTANELYLLIGVHGITFVSGIVILVFCSGFLPGFSDGLVLDRAFGVEGCMSCIHIAGGSTVVACIGGVGA